MSYAVYVGKQLTAVGTLLRDDGRRTTDDERPTAEGVLA